MTNTISLTYVYWNESGDTLYSPAFSECDDFYEWLVSHEENMRRMDLQREREGVKHTNETTEPKDGGGKKKKKCRGKRGAKNGVAGLASALAAFLLPFVSFSK
jgi:hypothetical protein